MPRKPKLDNSRLFDLDVCAFCGIKEDSEVLYGEFITSDNISMHSSCMFFASNLIQDGKDETDGFYGFLLPDIEKELYRGKKLVCSYCHKKGATIGCCEKKCKKCFHLPCGIKNNCLQQSFGQFRSYCKEHKPLQKPVKLANGMICHICCEKLSQKSLSSCLYSPCCKNSWFHKICLQKYALSAGLFFFKCPLCNNSKEFVKEMEIHGIRIPEKDASWELEENAYQELLHRPECDANICLCPKGRNFDSHRNSGWTLLSCSYCGSHARHKACASLKLSAHSWICQECKTFEKQSNSTDSATPPLNACSGQESKESEDLRTEFKTDSSSVKFPLTMQVSEIPQHKILPEENSTVNICSTTLKQNKWSKSENQVCKNIVVALNVNLPNDFNVTDSFKSIFDKNSSVENPSSSGIHPSSALSLVDKNNMMIYDNIPKCLLTKEKESVTTTGVEISVDESCNLKCYTRNILEDKTSEAFKHTNDNDRENSSNTKKLKTCSQDKEVSNLINITNSTNRPNTRSVVSVKSVAKKSKNKNIHVCHASKLCCIKKYFVSEPFQYRV